MIQRIQTLWLFLAGAIVLLTIQFPTYIGSNANEYVRLNGKEGGLVILLLTVLTAVIAFLALSMYKNRSTQIRLCVAGLFSEALLFFTYYQKSTAITQCDPSLTSILHPCVMLLFLMAARGIKRDQKLLRESDRLR